MAIDVEIPRRRFTIEEYHRMAEVGIFHPDERVVVSRRTRWSSSPVPNRSRISSCSGRAPSPIAASIRFREDVLLAVEVADPAEPTENGRLAKKSSSLHP